jgi:hypothetical protein
MAILILLEHIHGVIISQKCHINMGTVLNTRICEGIGNSRTVLCIAKLFS